MSTSKISAISVAIAISFGAFGAAQAAVQSNYDTLVAMDHTKSTKSRAEVQAEYVAAATAGLLPKTSVESFKATPVASNVTREQVRKEASMAKTSLSYIGATLNF